MQGGLKIPCKVTVSITGMCIKYKQLVEDLAVEEFIGLFLDLVEKDHSISAFLTQRRRN